MLELLKKRRRFISLIMVFMLGLSIIHTLPVHANEQSNRSGLVLAHGDTGREVPIGSSFEFTRQRALEVSVFNHYDISTGELTVRLSGPDAGSFMLRGGSGGSDSTRYVASIPDRRYRADAFSVTPRSGLSARTTPYTATVTVSSERSGIDSVSFQVRFLVSEGGSASGDVFTLTLRATGGGRVSLDGGSYGYTRTMDLASGERVAISAQADWDYVFMEWSYPQGEAIHPWREYTSFIMPNRNVTVFAHFASDRELLWDNVDRPTGPLPEVPAGIPEGPRPIGPPPGPGTAQTPIPTPLVQAAVLEEPPEPPAPVIVPLAVEVNGSRVDLSVQPAAMINGVPYIPVGGLFRYLGYNIAWDNETNVATLTRRNITIIITEGSRSFSINGINRNFPAPAIRVDGNLMVPFVEIMEGLGGRAHLNANGVINIFITR